MKRARREGALSQLYADLESGDFDAREYAIFQLALMLRRGSGGVSDADDYQADAHLSRTLLRIRPSPADHERIASLLLRLISRYADSRASAIWALSEVQVDSGFAAVVAAIRAHGDQFSDEAAYQACRALRTWLDAAEFAPSQVNALLDDDGALKWLRRWSGLRDGRLAGCARAVVSGALARSDSTL